MPHLYCPRTRHPSDAIRDSFSIRCINDRGKALRAFVGLDLGQTLFAPTAAAYFGVVQGDSLKLTLQDTLNGIQHSPVVVTVNIAHRLSNLNPYLVHLGTDDLQQQDMFEMEEPLIDGQRVLVLTAQIPAFCSAIA